MSAQIVELQATPAGNRQRVRLLAKMQDLADTPPYLELSVIDPDGRIAATTLVMGVMEPQMEMTLHLRPTATESETRPYRARGRLFFGSESQEEVTFSTLEIEFHFPQ